MHIYGGRVSGDFGRRSIEPVKSIDVIRPESAEIRAQMEHAHVLSAKTTVFNVQCERSAMPTLTELFHIADTVCWLIHREI